MKGWSQQLSPISPKNGIVINNDSILLRWNKLNNAQYYELKYTTDSTFLSNITSVNVGLQTTYWLTPLLNNTTYYWRIEGFDGATIIIGQARKFTNFKPTDLTGCSLWLRSDTGIVLSGNNVQSWTDLSSNAFSFSQATAGARPALMPNYFNGLPSLKFDGNDFLILNNFPYGAIVQGFIICRKPSPTTPNCQYLTGPNYNFEIINYYASVELSVGIVGIFNSLKWNQISLIRKSGDSRGLLNGSLFGTNTVGLNPISPGKMTIGSRDPILNASAPLQGEISEIIINTEPLSEDQISIHQNYMMDRYTPQLSLGSDTLIADNFCPITLSASSGFTGYMWSTGDTGISITVHNSGYYWVQSTDIFDRIHIDTIKVDYPQIQQLNSSTICSGSQLNWSTNLTGNYYFLWQDGVTTPNYQIVQSGAYYVKITDNYGCEFNSDTAIINIDYFADIAFLGNDTSLCSGNTLQLLNGANSATNYLWSDGTTNDTLIIGSGGTYWLEVSNINNCIARDTINITLTGIAPVSVFSASNVCIGLPMQFNDLSTSVVDSIVAWEWDFGDGNFSNIQHPNNLYLNSGVYAVMLKTIGSSGCAGLSYQTVSVLEHPNLDFISLNTCNDAEATLINTSNTFGGNINVIAWNFNDPQSSSNLANGNQVNHTYINTGIYNVSLVIATIEGCIDTLVKAVQIKPSPIATIENSKLCVGDSVSFKDITLIPFPQQTIYREWVFNDSIFSTLYEPKMLYNQAGNYNVKLYVMISNGCKDSIEVNININNNPTAMISIDKTCKGSEAQLIDTGNCENCIVTKWRWTSNNNIIGLNDSIFYTFNDTGLYHIELEVENTAHCKGYSQTDVHINEKPIAQFEISNAYASPPYLMSFENLSNQNLNCLWNFGDGFSDTSFEPNHLYTDTGNFNVSLTVFDDNNCSDFLNKNILLVPKRIDLAATNVKIDVKENYLFSTVSLINLGTVDINQFDIQYTSNGSPNNFVEHWEGQLIPGEIIEMQLKSSFQQQEGLNEINFICYEFKNVNKDIDNNISNNYLCKPLSLETFTIANLFPNPSEKEINLTLLAPFDDDVSIDIVDFKGSVIKSFKFQLKKGYNLINIETFDYQSGIYACKIKFKEFSSSINFVKYKP